MPDHVARSTVNGTRLPSPATPIFGSLVEFLRGRGLVGTKIGCGEGDCGACTVLARRAGWRDASLSDDVSCLPSLYQLDGTHIVTIEGLTPDGGLKPDPASDGRPSRLAVRVLHARVRRLRSRGFSNASDRSRRECAPHRIWPATCADARAMCRSSKPALSVDPASAAPLVEPLSLAARCTTNWRRGRRHALSYRERTSGSSSARAGWRRPSPFAPAPGAVIVGGGTELGLERNKQGSSRRRTLEPDGHRASCRKSPATTTSLSVGANVTWAQLEAYSRRLSARDPRAHPSGSAHRRSATSPRVVGNIAHGSPVADSLCFLLIVEAELELTSDARHAGAWPVKDFHTGPKQTVVAPDEIITRVVIPLPARDEIVKLYKISKRKEMDVSTFRAGIRIRPRGERIESAAIAYSRRRADGASGCRQTEAFLVGRPFLGGRRFARPAAAPAPRSSRSPTSAARASFACSSPRTFCVKFYHEAVGAGTRAERLKARRRRSRPADSSSTRRRAPSIGQLDSPRIGARPRHRPGGLSR